MKHAKCLILAALLLPACSTQDRRAYEASRDCAANELAWHHYVEQARTPGEMAFAEDRRRFAILTRRAEQAGGRLDLDTASVRTEIERRAKAARQVDDQRPLSASVDGRFRHARQCLASPTGSTALKAGHN